jgi:hypothetical protein
MDDTIQLGPMLVRTDMLILIVSVAAAFAVLSRTVRETPYARLADDWAAGLFIVIAAWKLSPIIQDPGSLLKVPALVLLMPGTRIGLWIGFALALIYIAYQLRRHQLSLVTAVDRMVLPIIVGAVLYFALTPGYGLPTSMVWGISAENPQIYYHPVNAYTALLLLPVMWVLWRYRLRPSSGRQTELGLIGFGFARMVSTLFVAPRHIVLGLSEEQWCWIGIMLAGMVIRIYRERSEHQTSLDL